LSSPRVGFIGLGCPKNQVDLEVMMGRVAEAGFGITARAEEADILVINTCSFLDSAIDEAHGQIIRAGRLKREGKVGRIVVSGCLPQYLKGRLTEKYPFVDDVLTPQNFADIASVLTGVPRRSLPRAYFASPATIYTGREPRVPTTPPSLAYVKIADGCNHRCAFCIIPALRGRYRSRPIGEIADEVKAHVARGVLEVSLVSQDTTRFGMDTGESLLDLLKRLARLKGDFWVRLMYLFPGRVTPEFVDFISAHRGRILPYFDVPVQHIAAPVLARMRRGKPSDVRWTVDIIRSRIADAVLRTNFIVGYPGETDADFAELVDFVKRGDFDRVGVFAYSNLPEMPSSRLPNHVPEAVKTARRDALMKAAMAASARRQAALVGRTLPVIIERVAPSANMLQYTGRSWREAYEFDGSVKVSSPAKVALYRRYVVEIVGFGPYDLIGKFKGDNQ
jgi:ribosomal protein S12 methylthiotransferase